MKNKFLIGAILLFCGSAFASQLDYLKWMAGSWQSHSAGGIFDITFTEPTGGLILGVSKLTDPKTYLVTFYEYIQIKTSDKGVVLSPMPFGQQGVLFAATEVTTSRVVFENPAHDFPRKVTYENGFGKQIVLTAEGIQGGKPVKLQFVMHKN